MPECYLGLGSNMGVPAQTVRDALARIGDESELLATSSMYGSAAWGVEDQDDFVNAVARIRDERHPQELLAWLHRIEEDFGRHRVVKWGPRVLDVDILTYGAWSYDGWELRIPHPGIFERAFVLMPLLEIAPDFVHPETGESARDALERLSDSDRTGVWKLDSTSAVPGTLPHS